MATPAELRHYLACWFQLGKTIEVQSSGQTLLPEPVFVNGSYSAAFEDCWQQCQIQGLSKCYLSGTDQSLAALLDSIWELTPCARCYMPIAQKLGGVSDIACPCNDLPTWPNTQLPAPRGEQDWRSHFQLMNQRLAGANARQNQS